MIIKNIFAVSLLLLSGCALSNEVLHSTALPSEFFKPTEGVEKAYVVGIANHIGVSDYEKAECPPEKVCLHLPAWQLYDIEGYVLPENNETEEIRVAHRYGSALTTETSWLATLEKISDPELRNKIGADYILVGVELSYNVFCPSKNSEKLFQKWESDFVNQKMKGKCFSL